MRLARSTFVSLAFVLRSADCGLRYEFPIQSPNPQSTIQSAIRNPTSPIRTDSERSRVLTAASYYLGAPPITITSFRASRSAGGPHDFFSEGDYWWPDPANPDGPYVRRDGESNPANFVEHRRALVRLSVEVPALAAAWTLTGDERYAAHARRHLRAWFADSSTRMSPDLRYAQAIYGVTTGRGTGIIDTIHLVEVTESALESYSGLALRAGTWPHELTREGVYGLEHRQAPEWARHNTTLPFTRFLAGAADYSPVVFGERRKDTTWAHQIATAVVFTSPVLVFGGHPQSLLDNPAVELIKSLPSVWDETIVLPGSDIGETAAFARRRGRMWFVGVLNGPTARTLTIDLGFLGAGRYDALVVRDKAGDAAAVVVEKSTAAAGSPLKIDLRAAGGFIARFTPNPEPR